MARLAGLLEAVGIQTWEHDEGEKVRLGDSPFVSFFGDDETERAALKVAWGAGYYPHLSERERHLIGEQMEEPVSYTLWFDRDLSAKEWRMMQAEATVREIGNPWLDDEEPAYSLAEIVKLFTDNGIKVSDSHIGGFGIHDFLPAIWFKTGDWATGERIAEIARQHELPVFSFDLMWLPYRKGRQIRWHMEFRRGVVRPS